MGTILNTIAVILGGGLGTLLGSRVSDRTQRVVMGGLGLLTLVIGMDLALRTRNVLVLLVSILLGGVLGESWRIEERLEAAGGWLEARARRREGWGDASVAQGFVIASLVFCVGPLTIVGSIQDGLTGDFSLLAIKSGLDGFAGLALASTLGIGVPLAALTVLLYQGSLTLLAAQAESILSQAMTTEMSATGGVLILGIGLLLLDLRRLPVANYLPALALAPLAVLALESAGIDPILAHWFQN